MSKLSIDQMHEIISNLQNDPELLGLYERGDRISWRQTKHDMKHALNVRSIAVNIETELSTRFPGRLPEVSSRVIIPAAAFFHDIGRAVEIGDHASAGEQITTAYLQGKDFPPEVTEEIAKIVALHRSKDFLAIPITTLKDFPELSIVVIADKCVGDEQRVRKFKRFALKIFSAVGLARRNFWDNARHDRVNYGIKNGELILDSDDDFNEEHAGAMILKLTVDTRVCSPEELLRLFCVRFQACVHGAKGLGFAFRVEINGTRYHFDSTRRCWCLHGTFNIARP